MSSTQIQTHNSKNLPFFILFILFLNLRFFNPFIQECNVLTLSSTSYCTLIFGMLIITWIIKCLLFALIPYYLSPLFFFFVCLVFQHATELKLIVTNFTIY